MELPLEIQEHLQSKIDNVKVKHLNSIFEKLSEDYIKNTGTGKEFLLNKDYVLVYALSRMNATFSVVDFVLEKFEKYIGQNINSILDVGAGMGTASINALYHFAVENIDLVERNTDMISLGKELLDLYNVKYKYINQDVTLFKTENKYDLVITSYFLSELNEKTRLKVLEKLWNLTDKYLIITDIGTPKGYENIIQIKEFLNSKGGKVLLPCPTEKCPIKDDWCHFVTRVNRTRINKLVKNAEVPFEDEKFCYLIVSKQGHSIVDNMVIRHPIKEKNVIKLKLCQNNSIIEQTITKNNNDYKRARKLKIGDSL